MGINGVSRRGCLRDGTSQSERNGLYQSVLVLVEKACCNHVYLSLLPFSEKQMHRKPSLQIKPSCPPAIHSDSSTVTEAKNIAKIIEPDSVLAALFGADVDTAALRPLGNADVISVAVGSAVNFAVTSAGGVAAAAAVSAFVRNDQPKDARIARIPGPMARRRSTASRKELSCK